MIKTTWTIDRSTFAPPITLSQTPDGFTSLQQHLHALGIPPMEILIVLEATGSYWMRLAVALHAAGYVLSVVNPTQVHHWAKSLPRRGKTDALDARMLTQYALERHPRAWAPPPDVYHELRQRLTGREGWPCGSTPGINCMACSSGRYKCERRCKGLRRWWPN